MHEASLYQSNCFVTLTYRTGCLPPGGSLRMKDFQDFMKRLRKMFGAGVRFFHCGEYGEKLGRPHYHAILFNQDFPDKKVFSKSAEGVTFTSAVLEKLWPHGFSLIGSVTLKSCAYVARYVLKKVTGELASSHYSGKAPEYVTMSRRPGIGHAWYEKFKLEVYPRDRVMMRGRPSRPPRYYDKQLDMVDRPMLLSVKLKRLDSLPVPRVEFDGERSVLVDDSSLERLSVAEQVRNASIRPLRRVYEEGS